MKAFEYVTADSFVAATRYLSRQPGESALVKAGGIDVIDRLKERLTEPQTVLNLRQARRPKTRIEERSREKAIAIHALATIADVAASEMIQDGFPALAAAAGDAATPQVRNVATVGGNLCQKPRCWYYRSRDFHCLKKGGGTCYAVLGDNRYHAIVGAGACHIVHPSNLAVPLLAYGAQVRLVRHEGGRPVERAVPLDEFFRVPPNPRHDEHILEPAELIEEVLVPLAAAGPHAAYLEVREKQSFDWPLVSCAVNLNDRNRPGIVLGAVAPIPWRLERVERLVAGRLTDTLIAEARAAAQRRTEPMSGNSYKVPLVGALVEAALRAADRGLREGDD